MRAFPNSETLLHTAFSELGSAMSVPDREVDENRALTGKIPSFTTFTDRVSRHWKDQRIKNENVSNDTLAFLALDAHLRDWSETLTGHPAEPDR